MLELDLLIKHSSLKNDVIVRPRIVIGEYSVYPNSLVKSEKVYGTTWHFSVVEQLWNNGKVEKNINIEKHQNI